MTADTRSTLAAKPGRYRWRVCAMPLAATTLNDSDRQLLGVPAQLGEPQ